MALIHIAGKTYELIGENKNGWNFEVFRDRYSEVLERYDYVVGDWGYNQLRLKGFFRDSYTKGARDSMFSTMGDYLSEYCNFGCAYFILEKKHGVRKEDTDFGGEELLTPELEEKPREESQSAQASAVGEGGQAAGGSRQHGHRSQRYKSRSAAHTSAQTSSKATEADASGLSVPVGAAAGASGIGEGDEEEFHHLLPATGGGKAGGRHSRGGRREHRRGSRGGSKQRDYVQKQVPGANGGAAGEAAATSEGAAAPASAKRNRTHNKKREDRS